MAAGSAPDAAPTRPSNARAVVEATRGELTIFIPAQGFRAETVELFRTAILWFGFVIVYTAGALGLALRGANVQWFFIGLACFSIPAWIVGFGILRDVAFAACGTWGVRLSTNEMITETSCLGSRRRRMIDRERVQSARQHAPKNPRPNTPSHGAEIIYEKGSYVLPTDNKEEAEWLSATINRFLMATQPRR